jgi:hypothetical protein
VGKPHMPKDGAPIGTTFLAVATVEHGNMVILGDLVGKTADTSLESACRDLASPGRPMHIVEVRVVARILRLDPGDIEPSVERE